MEDEDCAKFGKFFWLKMKLNATIMSLMLDLFLALLAVAKTRIKKKKKKQRKKEEEKRI